MAIGMILILTGNTLKLFGSKQIIALLLTRLFSSSLVSILVEPQTFNELLFKGRFGHVCLLNSWLNTARERDTFPVIVAQMQDFQPQIFRKLHTFSPSVHCLKILHV